MSGPWVPCEHSQAWGTSLLLASAYRPQAKHWLAGSLLAWGRCCRAFVVVLHPTWLTLSDFPLLSWEQVLWNHTQDPLLRVCFWDPRRGAGDSFPVEFALWVNPQSGP